MKTATRIDPPLFDGARTLAAGNLRAVMLPSRGMLCASLRHRGVETLRRLEDLEGAGAAGKTAGVPLLYPWANRLSSMHYTAAGRDVVLDPASRLLHLDDHGLPMHGVPWSRLAWDVTEATPDCLVAGLDWTHPDLLAVFPFPHRVELKSTLRSDGLTFEATLVAAARGPVPVSFGFHPYIGLPGLDRSEWRLTLPAMRKLALDSRGIPSGADEPFAGFDGPLGDAEFDDGFAILGEQASMSIGASYGRITVDLLEGFPHTQVFAPRGKAFVALEPMTAPTDALTSGMGLRFVEPNQSFRAVFRIRVDVTAA